MQLVSKGTLARMRREFEIAWEVRDLEKCIEVLQSLSRLAPAEPEVHLELGRVRGLIFDYPLARESFERAHRVAPLGRKTATLAKAGELASDFYNAGMAEDYLQRAVREKDAQPEMLVLLAEILERRRRMGEAKDLVDRAIRMNAQCPAALLARAHLHGRAGELQAAEEDLNLLLKGIGPKKAGIKAWYELGAILDRQGRFEQAMQAFLQAKNLLRTEGGRFLAQRRMTYHRVNQMLQQVTPDVFERWSQFGHKLQPARRLALLGGHPRSGTTLLEQVLDSHPEIASIEETDVFRNCVGIPLNRCQPRVTPILEVLETVSCEMLTRCREDYFSKAEHCLGASLDNRMLIDKNPALTISAPEFIRVFPEIRLLVALRDPRDVVLSCFMQPLYPVQHVNCMWLSLETAVEEYIGVMGTWRALAPMLSNPHLEVRYEDMVNDLEAVARRVLDFMQVTWDERVLAFDEHARGKQVRSPTYADVTEKVFTRAMGRWRNYQRYLEPHLPKLEPFVKAFGYE